MPAALEPAEPPLAGRRGGVLAARWTCGGAEDATARSPAPGHARSLDWRVLLAVRTDRWRAARLGGPSGRLASVANRPVTHPTRLETRTKESNMCASHAARRSRKAQWKWRQSPTGLGRIPPLALKRPCGRTAGPSRQRRLRGGARAYTLGPERWWTMPEQGEVRGNSDGGPQRFWRANRSSDLGIGAKD